MEKKREKVNKAIIRNLYRKPALYDIRTNTKLDQVLELYEREMMRKIAQTNYEQREAKMQYRDLKTQRKDNFMTGSVLPSWFLSEQRQHEERQKELKEERERKAKLEEDMRRSRRRDHKERRAAVRKRSLSHTSLVSAEGRENVPRRRSRTEDDRFPAELRSFGKKAISFRPTPGRKFDADAESIGSFKKPPSVPNTDRDSFYEDRERARKPTNLYPIHFKSFAAPESQVHEGRMGGGGSLLPHRRGTVINPYGKPHGEHADDGYFENFSNLHRKGTINYAEQNYKPLTRAEFLQEKRKSMFSQDYSKFMPNSDAQSTAKYSAQSSLQTTGYLPSVQQEIDSRAREARGKEGDLIQRYLDLLAKAESYLRQRYDNFDVDTRLSPRRFTVADKQSIVDKTADVANRDKMIAYVRQELTTILNKERGNPMVESVPVTPRQILNCPYFGLSERSLGYLRALSKSEDRNRPVFTLNLPVRYVVACFSHHTDRGKQENKNYYYQNRQRLWSAQARETEELLPSERLAKIYRDMVKKLIVENETKRAGLGADDGYNYFTGEETLLQTSIRQLRRTKAELHRPSNILQVNAKYKDLANSLKDEIRLCTNCTVK